VLSTVVRIAGHLTRTGARITLLTVRTTPGVRVTVRCTGRGCPLGRQSATVARAHRPPRTHGRMVTVRIRRAERAYPAGTRLEVIVKRRGRIGKYTRFVVRRGAFPKRRDACIGYAAHHPRPCPE
jgi:hypothetical protein